MSSITLTTFKWVRRLFQDSSVIFAFGGYGKRLDCPKVPAPGQTG